MNLTKRHPHWKARVRFGALVLVAAGLVAAAFAALFVWAGVFDVAATSKHSRPVALLLHYAMQRSVAVHAQQLIPPNLDDTARIIRGALHFAGGCAPCHGAPGELASPIAQQMTPTPPGLYSAGRDYTPSELFWIVKHGVKMTAMPAWPAQQRSDEIWDMVAFIKQLPTFNTERFAKISGWDDESAFLSAIQAAVPAGGFNPAACARCHGADGDGKNGASPKIAGLSVVHIVEALQGYRDGSKPSGFMQPVAAALTANQIEQAAKYYAALPAKASSR
jgi:cytochrome c553